MRRFVFPAAVAVPLLWTFTVCAQPLPEAVNRPVDFHREVLPILARRCSTCHASGRTEGNFSLENRDTLLRGGDSGAVVKPGQSDRSLLIELVAGLDPDRIMPEQGKRLTTEEIAILRAWIDQGVEWDGDVSLRRLTLQTWKPREVVVENAGDANPIDFLIQQQESATTEPADDRTWLRRVYLDVVGLLPTAEETQSFLADRSPERDARVVDRLFARRYAYAQHWMSFWNDLLRNDYAGTGFIDKGRSQITGWLYESLVANKPYDRFVFELIAAEAGAEGFTKGIVWRGDVNPAQRPPLQAAQNLSQVFLGLNLKCASCHDSFVSQWTLNDAYGLAAVFSDDPLDVFRCDKSTGTTATPAFFNREIGDIEFGADRETRQRDLAQLLTAPQNARLTRTIVNRLWARLMGRGIIEPVDEMDNEPWNTDLLDWLAGDLSDRGYDLQQTMRQIVLSDAYRSVARVQSTDDSFTGPTFKRMTAEQFVDTVWQVTGTGPQRPAKNVSAAEPTEAGFVRASLVTSDMLMRTLGRPNREQVVTTRPSQLTTLEALELANGESLEQLLQRGATRFVNNHSEIAPADAVRRLYSRTLCREPTHEELQTAVAAFGESVDATGIADLMWILFMLPEYQLIQ